MAVANKRLSDEEFGRQREEVLSMWHTGAQVDFDEAVEFNKTLPPAKNYARQLALAKETGAMLTRSDTGVPSVDEQTEYLKVLQEEGQCDLFGVIIDSLTRTHQYQAAEAAIEKSHRTGEWFLNGFPVVHYGVATTRKLTGAVGRPLQIRGVAPDWRLILEMGLASGFSASSGAGFISFSQFSKRVPLETTIRNYQYNYALMGRYEEAGVPMLPEISGGVGVLTPNSLLHAATVVDALVAAEQGVKNMSLMVHTQGNFVQDAAAMMALPQVCEEYLHQLGYDDVTLSVVATSWSGKFPEDPYEALAAICLGVVASVVGRVQVVHVKTMQEAVTIPGKEANAASLRAGKIVVNMVKDQSLELDHDAMDTEKRMQVAETKAIVDKVLEMGEGDIILGAVKATEVGVLDQVFATNQHVAGKVIGVRDLKGAVRYLDHGSLPFGTEILEFHREKISERESNRGGVVDYDTVVQDLFAISTGTLVQH